MDHFPEIAFAIKRDMNIVSREINVVNHITATGRKYLGSDTSDITLNVKDRDISDDANRHREEEQEPSEELEKRRGFRR